MKVKFTLLLLFISLSLSAQDRGTNFSDRLTYGGNIGLVFGTQTVVNISPRIGYYITDQFVAGVGVSYKYFKYGSFSDNLYGGSLFGRFFITEELFLHAETEMTNLTSYRVVSDVVYSQQRTWINSTMVGGGFRSGPFTLSALYILNHNPNTSPYGISPLIIQGGIMF